MNPTAPPKLLSNVDPSLLFCMFKGEPGTRKSTQALSFPMPQYWISTDRKMQALQIPAQKWGVNMSQVEYDDFSDWNEVKVKLERLQVNCKYKTIIVDSVTTMGSGINQQTLRDVARTTGEKGTVIGGIHVGTWDDYKAEVAAFQELVALLKDIHIHFKCNVILIAHVVGERSKEATVGSATHHSRIIVSGSRNLSAILSAVSTEVYHFDVRESTNPDIEGKYGLLTIHTGDDFARTSLTLPRRIDFVDKPLYKTYLLPAINKLKGSK